MQRRTILRILVGVIAVTLLILLFIVMFVDPWIGKKVRTALNKNNSKYQVEIGKIRTSFFTQGIVLKEIAIHTKSEYLNKGGVNARIASVKFKGIDLFKAIFEKDIKISKVIISDAEGAILLGEDSIQKLISSLNIQIDNIHFTKINLDVKALSSAKMYAVKEGVLNIYDLKIFQRDTLSSGILTQFDFKARDLILVSSDSMYTVAINNINCSAGSNSVAADSFSIHPNYKEYDFVSRKRFQTDRIEGKFIKIHIHDFSPAAYLKSKSLKSSYVEIAKMDIHIFRDKRKEFRHVKKPMFQDLIYNYPGDIAIDSVGLLNGKATYLEHDEKANHPGRISFTDINAKIYGITNDTVYKKEEAYLTIKGSALLMGKGRTNVLLKAKLYDRHNTFSVSGVLLGMDAAELNPMLERNAFVYATSGRIDKMDFSFTADNARAKGDMTLLYHGLRLAIKSGRTDDTTAFNMKFVSIVANIRVMDANPPRNGRVRVGAIDFERDPEKFIFSYCAKSILSGIKSSIAKSPRELLQNNREQRNGRKSKSRS